MRYTHSPYYRFNLPGAFLHGNVRRNTGDCSGVGVKVAVTSSEWAGSDESTTGAFVSFVGAARGVFGVSISDEVSVESPIGWLGV